MGDLCLGLTLQDAITIRSLGQGTYGQVNLVQKPNGQQYAVKYQPYGSSNSAGYGHFDTGISQATLIELDTLVRLRSLEYVVKIEGACIMGSGQLAMILEPMTFSLKQYIRSTPPAQRYPHMVPLMKDYLIASTVLEQININHYDVGTGNILIQDRGNGDLRFKLADFGLSRTSHPGVSRTEEIVTMPYRPPEILVGRSRSTYQEVKIDVWSFGAVLYEFLTGEFMYSNVFDPNAIIYQMITTLHYPGNFIYDVMAGTVAGEYPALLLVINKFGITGSLNMIPQLALELFQSMFALNPAQRPLPSQLLERFIFSPEQWMGFRGFIDALRPQDNYPRLVSPSTLTILRKTDPKDSYATAVVTIEILTRYFGSLGIAPLADCAYGAAGYHLASTYCDDEPILLSDGALKYNMCGPLQMMQVDQEEKNILYRLGFAIYNPNLTPRLKYLYETHGPSKNNILRYLRTLPPSHWIQPVANWFT